MLRHPFVVRHLFSSYVIPMALRAASGARLFNRYVVGRSLLRPLLVAPERALLTSVRSMSLWRGQSSALRIDAHEAPRKQGGGSFVGAYASRRWFYVDKDGKEFYMDPEEAETRILYVMKHFEKLEGVQFTKDSHFTDDLGLDSLDTVELLMAIEEEFDIQMSDAEADKISSVPETVDYIINHPYVQSLDV